MTAMATPSASWQPVDVERVRAGQRTRDTDRAATEAPLEIGLLARNDAVAKCDRQWRREQEHPGAA